MLHVQVQVAIIFVKGKIFFPVHNHNIIEEMTTYIINDISIFRGGEGLGSSGVRMLKLKSIFLSEEEMSYRWGVGGFPPPPHNQKNFQQIKQMQFLSLSVDFIDIQRFYCLFYSSRQVNLILFRPLNAAIRLCLYHLRGLLRSRLQYRLLWRRGSSWMPAPFILNLLLLFLDLRGRVGLQRYILPFARFLVVGLDGREEGAQRSRDGWFEGLGGDLAMAM